MEYTFKKNSQYSKIIRYPYLLSKIRYPYLLTKIIYRNIIKIKSIKFFFLRTYIHYDIV